MNKFENLEVLAPAGDWERFQAAMDYGADAIYLGAKNFGMRASPDNFTFEQLKKLWISLIRKELKFILLAIHYQEIMKFQNLKTL